VESGRFESFTDAAQRSSLTHRKDESGQDLHQRAERILGKRNYTHGEYLEALLQAQADTTITASVEELARELLECEPRLKTIEAARVLAEVKLGVRREPEDPVQATAERLARERGTRVDWIRDYRELAALYEEAERAIAAGS
jgi:hypothetical protein